MKETLISFHQNLRDKGFFRAIYLISLLAFAVGLLYSRAILSISQLALAAAFILEGDLKEKARRLVNNKIALLLMGIYFLHVLGLIFTEDFTYAWHDLRIKAPLLFYPVVFACTNFLSRDIFRKFNAVFILLVFSRTLAIAFYYRMNMHHIQDMRDAFFLISHIRFSLIICLSIMLSIYQFLHSSQKVRLIYILTCLWFFGFMLYFEMITGIVVSLLCFPVMVFHLLKTSRKADRLTKLVLSIAGVFVVVLTVHITSLILTYSTQNKDKLVDDIEYTTNHRAYQQPYQWANGMLMKENGSLIYQNICFKELEEQWSLRSAVRLNESEFVLTETGTILIRFLASKSLTKDSAGVSSLTDLEIKAVEAGITNVNQIGVSGYKVRIHNIVWELDNYFSGADFNGHSSAMRLEFWKTGLHIIRGNFWFGVGTGDQESAFQEQYDKDDSNLIYSDFLQSVLQCLIFV